MNKSETIKEIATALAKAQGSMTAAKMDAINPFLKNRYADLGSVIQAAKKPLADNGLSYSQHPSINETGVTVTTILMHESGEWLESELTLPLAEDRGRSLAQSMGAVITYMRRYALSAILGIYADEDTDGDGKQPIKKETEQAMGLKPKPQPTPGNGHAPEVPAEKPWTSTRISWETIQTITTTPKPNEPAVRYLDLPTDKLAARHNSMEKYLAAHPELEPDVVAEYNLKIDAAEDILSWRQ